MKAIIVDGVKKLSISDIPEPKPNKYQAIVRILVGSLCNGTDTKIFHGEFGPSLPTILGHEVVGEIIEVGTKVRNYKIGELVVRPRIEAISALGLNASFGSFVEFGLVTDAWAKAEDEGRERPWHDQTTASMDWDPLTLVQTITLKETLSFLNNLGAKKGDSILIFGSGPVGISFSLWSRYLGCGPVIVVGRREEACRRAKDFGKATHVINNRKDNVLEVIKKITKNQGVSYAIDAIGDNGILRDSLASLAPEGKVGIYGLVPNSQRHFNPCNDSRISKTYPMEAMVNEEVLRLVKRKIIPSREFFTHTLHFTECAYAFELLASHKGFKIGLNFA